MSDTTAAETVPAEVAYAGIWRIEPTGSNETATLTLRYPPSASNSSRPTALADLGLGTEALGGHQHPLGFELRREAGTFVCQGIAENGRGNGTFRFRPDSGYANAMAESGIPPLTLRQHIVAGLFDISSGFVKTIIATGPPDVTFAQLTALSVFNITPEDVRTLYAIFPAADFDDIRALAMTGVTAGYVDAMRRANIGDLSVDNVSALRASGIGQGFIEGLAASGRHALSIDEVVRLHSGS